MATAVSGPSIHIGSVWGRKGNERSSLPLLVSYDPASGRFQRFAIPVVETQKNVSSI